MTEELWVALRLVEAAVLGGLIGLERERSAQPAGLRTHLILCVGAALMMEISWRVGQGPGHDPGRIAAQVVSGIGFLGAGAILRLGLSIRGLTTAASLWTTAGIGLAVGAGYHAAAIFAVALILAALTLLKRVERALLASKGQRTAFVTVRDEPGALGAVDRAVSASGAYIQQLQVNKNAGERTLEVRLQLGIPKGFSPVALSNALNQLEQVTEAEVQ